MHFRAVTLVALMVVALFARTGEAQTSRPSPSKAAMAPAPAAVETIIRRPGADPTASTRPAGTAKPAPVGFDSTRVAISLSIVIALILVLRWVSKRMFGRTILGRSSRAIQVLSRNVISPKQQLLVVQVGRRLVVVGDSGQQMNPLCEITDPDEMAALIGQIQEEKRESMSNAFGSLFGRAGSDFGKDAQPQRSVDATDDEDDSEGPSDVRETREELNGLMDKVRLMSRQFRRT
ncbi:MAG: flagellar biosynthetic protein FliO [Tepidisphaeraceae bacterium]